MDMTYSRVLNAIDVIRKGGMVIMVDDEDRENEGDIVFAAEHVTPEKINFMAREARGLICLPLAPELVDQLNLPLMEEPTKSGAERSTAFTVSIEARHGVTTGISAADRSHTIKVAVAEGAKAGDLVVPGHIFPLRAKRGGTLERSGHTEGSVDLARLAGCKPAAVICEIMNDDGSMARLPDLQMFATKHNLPIISIEELIAYRLMRDCLVRIVDRGITQTSEGDFDTIVFESILDHSCHVALVKGSEKFGDTTVDVRVHRQRAFADVFRRDFSGKNDLVTYGLKMLKESGSAAVVYLSYPTQNPAFGLFKTESANVSLEDPKHKAMDARLLGIGAQIIRELGIQKMRTHVSQLRTLKGLSGFGLEVVENVLVKID